MNTYRFRAETPEGNVIRSTTGLSMAQVGGLIGNLADGDAANIFVWRESDNELVLRYDVDGNDL